jgi:hypothetical protein
LLLALVQPIFSTGEKARGNEPAVLREVAGDAHTIEPQSVNAAAAVRAIWDLRISRIPFEVNSPFYAFLLK